MPAAFRRVLGSASSLVVTQLDQCLAAYAPDEWAKLETQLAALPAFSKPVKALTRLLASRAADCVIDVQGRILVPSVLRLAAGLEAEVVIVGVLNRFEIWAPEIWKGFLADSERMLDDVSFDLQWPTVPGLVLPTASPASSPLPDPHRPQAKPKR